MVLDAARPPQGHGLRRGLPELQHLQRRRVRRAQGPGRGDQIRLEHGKPIRFGKDGSRGVALIGNAHAAIVDVDDVGEDTLLVHDAHRRTRRWPSCSRGWRTARPAPTPIGIFRQVDRPVYGQQMQPQIEDELDRRGPGDLQALLDRHGDLDRRSVRVLLVSGHPTVSEHVRRRCWARTTPRSSRSRPPSAPSPCWRRARPSTSWSVTTTRIRPAGSTSPAACATWAAWARPCRPCCCCWRARPTRGSRTGRRPTPG